MEFNDAAQVEQIVYEMRLADFPRGLNRARIDELFNGFPPYSEEEVKENNIEVNVNFLEGTRLAHDARTQFYSAFLKPGNFFAARTDMGPRHKRQKFNDIVTRAVNRPMKKSLPYMECFRSRFALDVMHGIGPATWENPDVMLPDPVGISDVLIPANTYLTMKNLPFYACFRSYTAPELIKLTRGKKLDPGWNKPLVDRCIDWIDKETMSLMGSNWPEVWAPERASERVKGDGGFYAGDQVPTIDAFDFVFWADDGKNSGWRRRIILDSWSTPQISGVAYTMPRKTGDLYTRNKTEFLYTSGKRNVAEKLGQLISFQFADLSAVAPFRYHSVRSLGFLLFAVLHLQNRLRSKFSEAVFEALMMYFRVKSMDDMQRALKMELVSRGFIDDSLTPLTANERYQVNTQLVELGIKENSQLIQEHSSSYVQNQNFSRDRTEKTKFQVMAEVNAMTSLVSAGLMQAYMYQKPEYEEIFRRFCNRRSKNLDILNARAECLRQGVPEKILVPEAWEMEPERVLGAGNKTLEMAIAEQLMQWRNLYDPDPQRQILRDATLAITDDAARAEQLVPDAPKISDSVHDAQLASGSLMQGLPVSVKSGINNVEYVETLLANMALTIQKATQRGNMAKPEEIDGWSNMQQHIVERLKLIAEDPTSKEIVRKFGDELGQLMNLVKGFVQRLQQAAAKRNGGGPQIDPKDLAKIQARQAESQLKSKERRESHAQRTAQRQIQFEQDIAQKREQAKLEIQSQAAKANIDIAKSRKINLEE